MVKSSRRIVLRPALFIFLLILLFGSSPASAQSGGGASLAFPQISGFPKISAYLDVRDSQGNFIYNLDSTRVTIVEDSQELPVDEFEEYHSGAQFAVAITPARTFTIRDGEGITRYERVFSALKDWANSQTGSNRDILSLMVTNGPEVSNLSDAAQWLSTLEGFQIDPQSASPNLDGLIRAVEMMNDEAPRPGMGRGILFVTPPLDSGYATGLSSLAAQAKNQKIHINVWMVSAADQFETTEANQLRDLAQQTEGQFVAFSGQETLPSLEDYMLDLRDIYRFSYRSKAISSGAHQFQVKVQAGDLVFTTDAFPFNLNIQPPNPMFVSPPEEILRQNPAGTRQPETDLVPLEQEMEVIIEFPDGLPRQIITSTLFVDGSAVASNLAAPFNTFTWDISRYLATGTHKLRVEAVDDLGLVGSSIEVPIKITVQRTPKPVWMVLEENALLIIGSLVALGLALLFLGLIISGRLRPRRVLQGPISASRRSRFWPGASKNKKQDPVALVEMMSRDQPGLHLPGWRNRKHGQPTQPAGKTYASLLPLQDTETSGADQPLLLNMDELKIGKDPSQVDYFLDDPSIDPLHTRLKKEAQSYQIMDCGSTAGTWVNFEPVPAGGKLLEHGDIIHIGRIGFRYSMRDTGRVRKVLITPEEKQL